MKTLPYTLTVALLVLAFELSAQFCNTSGNVIIFSNYDGGALTISVDQNIPNLKIGVCSYEDCAITITGPYASNVTQVLYAGFQGNNDHCNLGLAGTTISAPSSATTAVLFAPSAGFPDPNGNASIICAYSCQTSNQGGCNTAQQIASYFLNQFGGQLYLYYTQYGCWPTSAIPISSGGTCCPGAASNLPPSVSIVSSTNALCAGDCTSQVFGTTVGATSWSWDLPGSSTPTLNNQNPSTICYDTPGTYNITLTATNSFGATVANTWIEVVDCVVPGCMYPQATNYNPQATLDDQSCVFNCTGSCTGDLDGNGIVGVSDLLIFISVFGNACPN